MHNLNLPLIEDLCESNSKNENWNFTKWKTQAI